MFSALTKRVNLPRDSILLRSKRDYCIKSIKIQGLPYDSTAEQIKELFSPFGEIYGIFLPARKNGNKILGFGYLRYIVGERPANLDAEKNANHNVPTPEEIEKCSKIIKEAITKMDRFVLGDRYLEVTEATQDKLNVTYKYIN